MGHGLDHESDHGPHLHRLAILGHDVWKTWIRGLQLHATGPNGQCLTDEFPVDYSHHHMPTFGLNGFVDDQHVAIGDSGLPHRVTPCLHQKRCCGVIDQPCCLIYALGPHVLCWRRKARLHLVQQLPDELGSRFDLDEFALGDTGGSG